MAQIETSNWINLGILLVTGVVGILSWIGARKSAKEAGRQQVQANEAATRSADAAEKAVKIEEERQKQADMQSRKAHLACSVDKRQVFRHGRSQIIGDEWWLVIKNTGAASAVDVKILLNGRPIDECHEFQGKFPEQFEISPKSSFERKFEPSKQLHQPFNVELSWSDDSGGDSLNTSV